MPWRSTGGATPGPILLIGQVDQTFIQNRIQLYIITAADPQRQIYLRTLYNRNDISIIITQARELVKTYPFLSDDKAQMFKPEREALGSCPRCGSPVYEGKKNYYCSNKECIFTMWKNDRFFEERKVAFSPKIAAALLQSGKVNVKKLYSPKTGKTYDGTIVLADTGGKYVNYRVELPKKK